MRLFEVYILKNEFIEKIKAISPNEREFKMALCGFQWDFNANNEEESYFQFSCGIRIEVKRKYATFMFKTGWKDYKNLNWQGRKIYVGGDGGDELKLVELFGGEE